MNLIEKLKAIGVLMSEIVSPVKLSFSSKLEDGTPVIFEPELSLGAVAMLTTDEGTLPVADGEYKLEGGKSITVYEGKVSKLGDTPAESDSPATDELSQVLEQKLSLKFGQQFVTLANVQALEAKLAAQDELIAKQTVIMSEMVEALKDIATAAPTREIPQGSASKKTGFDPERVAAALAEVKKEKQKMKDTLENMIQAKPQ